MKTVLTIAGSDCSGGAGIQADIKTIAAHKLYAMSVITALTAQNTRSVRGVQSAGGRFVGAQMDAVFSDIFPDAVKIGMVAEPEIIKMIAHKLKKYKARNIVLDPVMVSTSGSRLISPSAEKTLKKYLFPLADLVTPNISEAEVLGGVKIENKADMLAAAKKIFKENKVKILIKGGHLADCADDLFYDGARAVWFKAAKVDNPNSHGTGCTLSSAIAANLAKGRGLRAGIENAKKYVTGALKAGLDLGAGAGPLEHGWNIKIKLQ